MKRAFWLQCGELEATRGKTGDLKAAFAVIHGGGKMLMAWTKVVAEEMERPEYI